MNTAFGALTGSLNGQRQQLEAFASQQQAASSAMLQHTQSAIALARQHLHEAGAATTTCQQNVDHTLSAQSSALSAFAEGFACGMQEDQVCALSIHHFHGSSPQIFFAEHTPLVQLNAVTALQSMASSTLTVIGHCMPWQSRLRGRELCHAL